LSGGPETASLNWLEHLEMTVKAIHEKVTGNDSIESAVSALSRPYTMSILIGH
jgi:hypothetical protein